MFVYSAIVKIQGQPSQLNKPNEILSENVGSCASDSCEDLSNTTPNVVNEAEDADSSEQAREFQASTGSGSDTPTTTLQR